MFARNKITTQMMGDRRTRDFLTTSDWRFSCFRQRPAASLTLSQGPTRRSSRCLRNFIWSSTARVVAIPVTIATAINSTTINTPSKSNDNHCSVLATLAAPFGAQHTVAFCACRQMLPRLGLVAVWAGRRTSSFDGSLAPWASFSRLSPPGKVELRSETTPPGRLQHLRATPSMM